jgi:branched-chain amino acid transport system substrate-binding protein
MNPVSYVPTCLWRGLLSAAACGALALAPSLAAAQQATGEPIKIGVVLAITGPGAGLGIPTRNGALLAEKAINASGGVRGRPIKLLIEDDASNPDNARTKANALVHNEKVVALLGPSQVAQIVAAGAVTDPLKLPQIVPAGLSVPVERERRCIYHLLPPQDLNARALMEYAANSIKVKRVGVLHDSGYGNVVMNALKSISSSYPGIEFVAVEKFEIGATDVTTQAAKVRAANPETVMVIATSGTPFRAVKQIRLDVPVIAAIGSSSYEYVKAMGEGADNVVIPEFLVGEDPLPEQKTFVDMYRKEYNHLPKNFEAAGWDMVQFMAAALRAVGPDAKPAEVCEWLRRPHKGVLADYDFREPDLTGMRLTSYVYSKLVNGQYTRLPFRVTK